jgi:hypothetical protein
MLLETFYLLETGTEKPVINNALIEAFCIHARNLDEFFACKKGVTACNFTTNAYKPEGLANDHVRKLNHQIAHIDQKRTTNVSDKINGNDRRGMLRNIMVQRQLFVGCLADRWKSETQKQPCFADGWPGK